jgi:hypothetical protein
MVHDSSGGYNTLAQVACRCATILVAHPEFHLPSMIRRFTLAGMLMWVALVALVLAIVVPIYRWRNRSPVAGVVTALAASADGSTFAALLGDGTIRIWDSTGRLKTTLHTQCAFGGMQGFALSSDGSLAAVLAGWSLWAAIQDHIEVWDIGAGKLLKTMAVPDLVTFTFLPGENRLVVQRQVTAEMVTVADDIDEAGEPLAGEDDVVTEVLYPAATITTEIYSLTDDLPPRTLSASESGGFFSPDGKRFAALKSRIQIYDAATLRAVQEFDAPQTAFRADLAWAPDGQSLSLLQTHTDEASNACWQTIEHLPGFSAAPRIFELGKENHLYQTITYFPGGRVVALAGQGSGMALLDAKSFMPLATESTAGVSQMAAGVRGDTFITAATDSPDPSYAPTHVDLWDVATLRPRRRIFEQTAPAIWPPVCGLMVWLAIFVVRWRRLLSRAARRS